MTFPNLSIKSEYRSPQDNIVQNFYLPVLENAVSYRRSVGFFSSSALVEITEGICALAKKGGKIELVASPRLSAEDLEAISKGYEQREKIIENALLRGLKSGGEKYFEKERLNLLANLIENGVLDIKIAFTENENSIGIYHEKLGLVEDCEENKIAFSGSMNESENAFTKNYETIDVFCSWKNTDEKQRVLQKLEAFARIWNNIDEKLKVKSFPSINKAILEKYKRNEADFELDKKEFCADKNIEYKITRENKTEIPEEVAVAEKDEKQAKEKKFHIPDWLKLYPYQQNAIENWKKQNYIGIYDMATGTGKTLTALSSLYRLYEDKGGNFCAVILCPYIHLVMQWVEEIKEFNIRPIIAFGDSPQKDWKEKLYRAIQKRNFHSDEKGFFCLISSMATFKRDFVQQKILKIKKPILLIADEAHNLGSQNSLKYLDAGKYKYRLALSATLERHFDESGTQKLYDFFGKKCIEYKLKQAIDDGYLTPYEYHPIVTTLDFEEKEKYLDLSKSIANEVRIDENGKKVLSEKGKMLCIMRSRIIAGARSKIAALVNSIEPYKNQFSILIYCGAIKYCEDSYDSQKDENAIRQIDEIIKLLYEKYQMKISKFIAEKTSEERNLIVESFKNKKIQAIAAIKCLDEGVNIPAIKTAFILASSTNPKEYIQRRGRVLRLSEGKDFAEIYDFVCLPDDIETLQNKTFEENESFKSLALKEVRRMREFSGLSSNPHETEPLIEKIEGLFNIDENTELEDYEDE